MIFIIYLSVSNSYDSFINSTILYYSTTTAAKKLYCKFKRFINSINLLIYLHRKLC